MTRGGNRLIQVKAQGALWKCNVNPLIQPAT